MTVKDRDRVVFRKWPNGDIIALFIDYQCGRVMSFEHIGQHGEADYGYVVDHTVPATSEEYGALYNELTHVYGYNLEIRTRWNRRDQ